MKEMDKLVGRIALTGISRVLEKSGFRHEGLAKKYMKINDAWEDHHLFAITSEMYRAYIKY